MKIFPAIDIKDGNVVRLRQGDYNQLTVYSCNPMEQAAQFRAQGAEYLHVVDLDGARSGLMENYDIIKQLAQKSGMLLQVGGGIRNEDTVKRYIEAGAYRVILGTVAVENPDFAERMTAKHKGRIAVGVDIRSGYVATRGWTQLSNVSCFELCEKLCKWGVTTMICTDISRDGVSGGTNRELYRSLMQRFDIDIIASGGVSNIEEIKALRKMDLYGAIVGKALYTGAVNLGEAIEEGRKKD